MERKENNDLLDILKRIRSASSDEEAKELLLLNIQDIFFSDDVVNIFFKNKVNPSLLPKSCDDKQALIDWYIKQTNLFSLNLQWNKRENEKDVLSSNDEYINWLISFLKLVGEFDSEGYVKNPKQLSEIDHKNMQKLEMFADTIVEYADNNHIMDLPINGGILFYIRFLDTTLEMGLLHGNGVVCYIRLADHEISDDSYLIHYEKIINKGKEKTRINSNHMNLDWYLI